MDEIKEKSIRCDCGGGEHYLHFFGFEQFKDEPKQLYVDLLAKSQWPFGQRIKEVIKVLKGQPACYDGIILDRAKSFEIIDFLRDFWKDEENG